jgi:hypothetical protein
MTIWGFKRPLTEALAPFNATGSNQRDLPLPSGRTQIRCFLLFASASTPTLVFLPTFFSYGINEGANAGSRMGRRLVV